MKKMIQHNVKHEPSKNKDSSKTLKMEEQSIKSKVPKLFLTKDKNDESIEINKHMLKIMQILRRTLKRKSLHKVS